MAGLTDEQREMLVETEKATKFIEYHYNRGRNDVIEEFLEAVNKKITDFILEHKDQLDFASGVSMAWNFIDEVAEQMKGGK